MVKDFSNTSNDFSLAISFRFLDFDFARLTPEFPNKPNVYILATIFHSDDQIKVDPESFLETLFGKGHWLGYVIGVKSLNRFFIIPL